MPKRSRIISKRKHMPGRILSVFAVCFFVQQIPLTMDADDGSPNDIQIISNNSVAESAISPTVARDLFLKVRKAWKNGAKAIPIVPGDDQLQNDFRRKVLNMDAAAEKRYWEDVKIKYGLSKPTTLSDSQKAIFSVKGAITYIYRKDYKAGATKIICVVP